MQEGPRSLTRPGQSCKCCVLRDRLPMFTQGDSRRLRRRGSKMLQPWLVHMLLDSDSELEFWVEKSGAARQS